MPASPAPTRYRFGIFEADPATGELRRQGMRIKLHAQPFQILILLLERPGQMLSREEISRELWPDQTFVDFDHGVNSAINRLREALSDKAASPRFVETIARRGYRFVAPVERIVAERSAPATITTPEPPTAPAANQPAAIAPIPSIRPLGLLDHILATPQDLPASSHPVIQTLFILFQIMYIAFYVGALANLPEIDDLLSPLRFATRIFAALIVTAALLIPVRTFLACAVLFHAPAIGEKFMKLWPLLLLVDVVWSLAPFLLLHHINYGLAMACTAFLVYAPFAQRSLVLMGAGERPPARVTSA